MATLYKLYDSTDTSHFFITCFDYDFNNFPSTNFTLTDENFEDYFYKRNRLGFIATLANYDDKSTYSDTVYNIFNHTYKFVDSYDDDNSYQTPIKLDTKYVFNRDGSGKAILFRKANETGVGYNWSYVNAEYYEDVNDEEYTYSCETGVMYSYYTSTSEIRSITNIVCGISGGETYRNSEFRASDTSDGWRRLTGGGSTWDYLLKNYLLPGTPTYDGSDPYAGGGTSEAVIPNGNFSEDSDTVTEDNVPYTTAIGTGFATVFTPSLTQLKDLSEFFWGSNMFQALQNSVENITEMFVSLGIVPFQADAGDTVYVTWLGLDIGNVQLTLAARQYYEFDMGSIDLSNDPRIFTSDTVLDYSPFSRLGIYLPFIGNEELDIDECRNAVINLKYRIDILTGCCVALINVDGNTIYQFAGNCLMPIPLTHISFSELFGAAVDIAIAGAAAAQASQAVSAAQGAALPPHAETAAGARRAAYAHDQAVAASKESANRAGDRLATTTANSVIGAKPRFNKSGSLGSSVGLMSVKQPYLYLITPRQSLPENYGHYNGYPSNITSRLGDLSGYTVVEDIRLNDLVATQPEVIEIYKLLREGVII